MRFEPDSQTSVFAGLRGKRFRHRRLQIDLALPSKKTAAARFQISLVPEAFGVISPHDFTP